MTRRAVTDPVTGRVKRWGDTDFTSQLNGDIQTVIDDGALPDPALALDYQKIVGTAFAAMSAPERAAVDAQLLALDNARLPTAPQIFTRAVQVPADLPLPPPRPGLVVAIRNTGGGVPGLAYSSAANWIVFRSDSVI